MKKHLTPEQLLSAMVGIDDASLAEAERIKPHTGKRRLLRVVSGLAAAVLLFCGGLVLSSYLAHRRLYAEDQGTGSETQTSFAMYADILYYNGMCYSYVGTFPGRCRDNKLGKVEVSLRNRNPDYDYDPASGTAAATFAPVGARIWTVDDWNEQLFVCTDSPKWGKVDVFERSPILKTETVGDPSSLLPDADLLCRAELSGTGTAVITDRKTLAKIGETVSQSFVSLSADTLPAVRQLRSDYLALTLYYGNTLFGQTLYLYQPSSDRTEPYGEWMNGTRFSLPDGFYDTLFSYTVYRGNGERTVYGENAVLRSTTDFSCFTDGTTAYTDAAFFTDRGNLYVSSPFDLYWEKTSVLLEENAAGCLRAEYNTLYYLTSDGAAAYLVYDYPETEDFRSFSKRLADGEDMRAHVTEKGILYPGPYETMQVRDGVVWGLSADGNLYRNGELHTSGVLCFALDPDGVTYGTENGLFRDSSVTGKTRLSDLRTTTVFSCGYTLYFGTEKGLYRTHVDGSETERITKIVPASLEAPPEDIGAVVMTLTDTDGNGYIFCRYENEDMFFRVPDASPIDSVTALESGRYRIRNGDETRIDYMEFRYDTKTMAYYRDGYASGKEPETVFAE